MKQAKPWGKSLSINLYECDHQTLLDEQLLRDFIRNVIKLIGMQAHGTCYVDQFGQGKKYGFSALQFIETSTITVHLDDKGNRAFIDIFSCQDFNTKAACDFAKQYFQAKHIESTTLIR